MDGVSVYSSGAGLLSPKLLGNSGFLGKKRNLGNLF